MTMVKSCRMERPWKGLRVCNWSSWAFATPVLWLGQCTVRRLLHESCEGSCFGLLRVPLHPHCEVILLMTSFMLVL